MKERTKVSVIIPVYNEEKYIQKTLTAISFQSYDDYEIIIINNNSTDKSEAIIKDFIANNSFRINIKYAVEFKQGTNAARECGRRLASGDILAFLDADCLPEYHWVQNGVRLFSNKDVVAATGAYFYFDDTNVLRRYISLYTQLFLYRTVNNVLQYFGKGAIIIGGNCFIRTNALYWINGFNTELSFYGDDSETATRLSKVGKVKYSSSIILKTSARRFKELGFYKTNAKYIKIFRKVIFGKAITKKDSIENVHPR